MSDYKSYSCALLLDYFDSSYNSDTDRTDYAQYLLTMLDCNSIKGLIKIYDKVLRKFLVKYNGIGNVELVSESWYNIYSLSNDTRVYWLELNTFLNENIERIFNIQDYSDDLAIACFINLREAHNFNKIWQTILSKSSDNVSNVTEDLENDLYVVNDAPNHISPNDIGTNGYRDYKSKYIKSIKKLINYGYIRSIKDKTFELKNKISYFPNKKSLFQFVAIILIALIFFMLVITYFDFSLFTLIILIGLPGALISFLR